MLCSVYEESVVDIGDVPWRRREIPDADLIAEPEPEPEQQPEHKPEPEPEPARDIVAELSEEIALLQSRMEELQLLSERQVKEAWENGLRAGDAGARKALDEQVQASVAAWAAMVVEVSGTRPETIRRAEADTVRLAMAIARRVLHRELAVDPAALEALIRAALVKLQTQEVSRVRVNPEMEKLVRDCLDRFGRGSSVEIVPDPSQSKGGALFEIGRGVLDASVDTQLREIENGLADEMRRRL